MMQAPATIHFPPRLPSSSKEAASAAKAKKEESDQVGKPQGERLEQWSRTAGGSSELM